MREQSAGREEKRDEQVSRDLVFEPRPQEHWF